MSTKKSPLFILVAIMGLSLQASSPNTQQPKSQPRPQDTQQPRPQPRPQDTQQPRPQPRPQNTQQPRPQPRQQTWQNPQQAHSQFQQQPYQQNAQSAQQSPFQLNKEINNQVSDESINPEEGQQKIVITEASTIRRFSANTITLIISAVIFGIMLLGIDFSNFGYEVKGGLAIAGSIISMLILPVFELGKKILGIQIVDAKGQPIGIMFNFVRMWLRLWALPVTWLTLKDQEDPRMLHDRAVDTYVVHKIPTAPKPQQAWQNPQQQYPLQGNPQAYQQPSYHQQAWQKPQQQYPPQGNPQAYQQPSYPQQAWQKQNSQPVQKASAK